MITLNNLWVSSGLFMNNGRSMAFGNLADRYRDYLADPDTILIPAIILYEV